MPAWALITLLTAAGLAVSYLVGSIPDGLIVGKLYGGYDVRKHGSGNVGTTNTLRLAGWKPGILVFVLDMLKGVVGPLVMLIANRLVCAYAPAALGGLLGAYEAGWIYDLSMGLAMFFVVLGHMHSPFMGFKGGKGIATSFGAFFVVVPWCALTAGVAFVLLVVLTRRVSAGSLAGDAGYLIGAFAFYWGHFLLLAIVVVHVLMVLWAHRGNISRLARGEEKKLSVGSKDTARRAHDEEVTGAARAEAEVEAEVEAEAEAEAEAGAGCGSGAGADRAADEPGPVDPGSDEPGLERG